MIVRTMETYQKNVLGLERRLGLLDLRITIAVYGRLRGRNDAEVASKETRDVGTQLLIRAILLRPGLEVVCLIRGHRSTNGKSIN